MEKKQTGRLIGIDLGTTNSCVAVWENGKAVVIPNSEGAHITPSAAAFCNGEWIVGSAAAQQAVLNPDYTFFSVKRDLESARTVQIEGKAYTSKEILAQILQKLKQDAEACLGEDVTQAVITIPSCFSDFQRRAIWDAGRIAGLEVLRLINGPSAAALVYGHHKSDDETILVYDLGGGMFSVTAFDIGDGVFEVLATAGSNRIGGVDFDQKLTDYLAEDFKQSTGIDLRQDKMAMLRLKEAAEQAKIELSNASQTTVSLQYVAMDESGPKHLEITITRAKFNKLTADLVKQTEALVKRCLADAARSPAQVDKIILVGGSSRIPMVRDLIKKTFGKEPFRGIHPDECFAAGAAIECGVLTGEIWDVLLLEVTPISLGVETVGGVFTKLVDRNTTIPTMKSQTFSTASDNQTGMIVHVLEGEHAMAQDNKTLGHFQLTGIAPAPRGVPQIEITFEIDRKGYLSVSAKDLGTGKKLQLTSVAANDIRREKATPAAAKGEGQKIGKGWRPQKHKSQTDGEKQK